MIQKRHREKNKARTIIECPDFVVCRTCRKLKPNSEFHKSRTKKNGLQARCKDCHSTAVRLHDKKPERKLAKAVALKNWQAENRIKTVQYSSNRRALERNQIGWIPDDFMLMMIDCYGFNCSKCNSSDKINIDHIVPLSWGNQSTKLHDISNLQFLCQSCNNSKKDRENIDYRTFEQICSLLDNLLTLSDQ